MRHAVTLITGAGGEIGHGLIERLAAAGRSVVTIDIAPIDASLSRHVHRAFTGSVTDPRPRRARARAVRSGPRVPPRRAALHAVRVHADLRARRQRQRHARTCSSSRSAKASRTDGRSRSSTLVDRGLRTPDVTTKAGAGPLREEEWNAPLTMYGCNKLYCEHLGRYFGGALQAARGRRRTARRLPLRPVSRSDFRRYRCRPVARPTTRPR